MARGWYRNENPIEGIFAQYRWASLPIRQRISYCKRRAKKVGSLALRSAWRSRQEEAETKLRALQCELIQRSGWDS